MPVTWCFDIIRVEWGKTSMTENMPTPFISRMVWFEQKCTVKYNRIFRNTTGCHPRLGIRDVDVLWRWPSILGSPVNDRCVPAAAVTWQALIGGPAQLAGVLAWLLCHGRQSASPSCWRSSRKFCGSWLRRVVCWELPHWELQYWRVNSIEELQYWIVTVLKSDSFEEWQFWRVTVLRVTGLRVTGLRVTGLRVTVLRVTVLSYSFEFQFWVSVLSYSFELQFWELQFWELQFWELQFWELQFWELQFWELQFWELQFWELGSFESFW